MIQITRILCPIDFSEFSRHALDHAMAIARLYGSRVIVLHVFPLAVEAVPFAGLDPQPFVLHAAERVRLLARMKAFAAAESGAGFGVDCVVREGVDIHAEILAETDALDPDLLVMGTHGRSGFQHLVLGSVTEQVLRKADCPVLTVPRRAPAAVPTGPILYTRILCGVDFSECSLAALAYARSLAAESQALLEVVNVVNLLPIADPPAPIPSYYPGLLEELQAHARTRLRDTISALTPPPVPVNEIVTTGKPHQEIVRLAAERKAELIVLGVHGSGVIDRMIFGSTTNHVVRQATCPVLTIRT